MKEKALTPMFLVSRIETRLPTDKKGPWKDQQGLTGEMLLFLQFASTHPSADTNARNVFRDVSNISIAGIDVYAFDFDTSEKPRACAWLGESKAANTGSSLTSQMNSLDKRYSSEISLSVFRTLINSNIANYEMQGEMDKAKAIRLLIVDFVKRDANCRINCAPFIVYNAALDIEKQLKRIPKWKTVSVWPKDSIHMHSLPVEEWGDKVKEWWKNYVT